jgi:DNA repair exonuclease SbcCD ATPase subunit
VSEPPTRAPLPDPLLAQPADRLVAIIYHKNEIIDAKQAELDKTREELAQSKRAYQYLEESGNSAIKTLRSSLSETMIHHGLATGHGETIGDLILELNGQLSERREQFQQVASRLEQSKKLYEMTLSNEVRWMNKHSEAEQERDKLREELADIDELAREARHRMQEWREVSKGLAEVLTPIGCPDNCRRTGCCKRCKALQRYHSEVGK